MISSGNQSGIGQCGDEIGLESSLIGRLSVYSAKETQSTPHNTLTHINSANTFNITSLLNQTKLAFPKIGLLSMMLSGLLLNNIAHGALSATTKGVIHGRAPYLTFDGGATKATDVSSLLWIKLSDDTVYTQASNPSSATSPITLPVSGQMFSDITTLLSSGQMSETLTNLIGAPNNYAKDNDGDASFTATGSLTMELKDADGNTVGLDDTLELCSSPYALTLTTPAGTLETAYGVPNSMTFTGGEVTYYLKPKITTTPYTCYAQPNLEYTSSGYYAPSYAYWNTAKGFKPVDIYTPSKNFPTMGANGLFFDLTVAGALGSDVTYSKSPATSSIDITLTAASESNVVRIELTGPKYGATKTEALTAVPTTFTFYSDLGKTNNIYSFTIGNWFIAQPSSLLKYSNTYSYCTSIGYQVPGVRKYTNANSSYWTGGLSGQGNKYSRRIGGGLFAEWGNTRENYPDSDFYGEDYWAAEKYTSSRNFSVYSNRGFVSDSTLNIWSLLRSVACIK